MKITVNKRFLAFPVSYNMQEKRILFYRDSALVLDLVARLDNDRPDTYYYIDMRNFFGDELTLQTEPEMTLSVRQTDTPDPAGLYQEKYRPTAHFTAARGWINDPNGLVRAGGVYHLFFQHNPAGRDWGNMHWGHAVSTDLVHWEEREIALFPDEMGTMFSGSGIEDVRNLTGLKENGQNPILLFYTAAGGKSALSHGQPFTQCLAYSTDGGRTFRKYEKNPLIGETVAGNRDPKVVYCPEMGCYYLALFLKDHRYALYVSEDLLNWRWRQELILPDDGECPDLYPLPLDGTGETYWVFSGASDRYLVGRFDQEGLFVPVQPAQRLHYGTCNYAAQTFSGLPNGRVVRIAWNKSRIPGTPFNCSMCTPAEMRLKMIQNEIRLCAMPVAELEGLYAGHWEARTTTVEKGSHFSCPLTGKAQDIRMDLTARENAPFRLTILGMNLELLPGENCIKYKNMTMPLFMEGGRITLRIITDTSSVEVYADRGEAFLCVDHVADYNLDKLTLHAGDSAVTVHEIKIDTLRNIWDGAREG